MNSINNTSINQMPSQMPTEILPELQQIQNAAVEALNNVNTVGNLGQNRVTEQDIKAVVQEVIDEKTSAPLLKEPNSEKADAGRSQLFGLKSTASLIINMMLEQLDNSNKSRSISRETSTIQQNLSTASKEAAAEKMQTQADTTAKQAAFQIGMAVVGTGFALGGTGMQAKATHSMGKDPAKVNLDKNNTPQKIANKTAKEHDFSAIGKKVEDTDKGPKKAIDWQSIAGGLTAGAAGVQQTGVGAGTMLQSDSQKLQAEAQFLQVSADIEMTQRTKEEARYETFKRSTETLNKVIADLLASINAAAQAAGRG
ncbi:MAG: hypothetical protein ACRCV3_00650 [Desulfovibrionaceae bacterium]